MRSSCKQTFLDSLASNINIKHCVILAFCPGSALWNHIGAADLQRCNLNHFFFNRQRLVGGGVKGQLSQKPQRILLGEDPWDSSLKPRHHGQVSQVCPAAAPGPEYICVFIGCCGTTSPQNPRPFPQSTLRLVLMFEWAYWSSTTLFRVGSGRANFIAGGRIFFLLSTTVGVTSGWCSS